MWDPWADTRALDELRGRLKWFLLGRLLVVSCFLLMVAVGYLKRGTQDYIVSVNWLLFAVGTTYAFTLVSALLLNRLTSLRWFTHTQVFFDVALITGVLHLTGGYDSPFTFLYGLSILNGATLLLSGGALFAAVSASLLYDCLLLAQGAGAIDSVQVFPIPSPGIDAQLLSRIITTNTTFVLTALVAGFLTRRLHQAERLLEEEKAQRDRLATLQETLARAVRSALITTDPDGRITSADDAAGSLCDCATADLVGTDIGTVFPALKLAATARLRFLQSPGALEPIEFTRERPEGPMQIRCSAASLRDTYGNSIGALYVLQNVTEVKAIAETPVDSPGLAEICAAEITAETEVTPPEDGLYGHSEAITEIRSLIKRVGKSDATVLITGESGTGKEVVARAIHAQGPRRDKRFVAINCGAIPEDLIESELFGHVRGAFTGAVADRPGCFRMADGGSIFLDEIGELPLHLQVKLLRVLQERVFRPVGSEKSVAVNVRIIAATNRNLTAQVREGKFREDLFYRLNVIHIEIPPLRERREDIPLLLRHFLRQFSDAHGRVVDRFSLDAGRLLLQHDYPGNVRELENIVEHAVALADGDTATVEHLPGYLHYDEEDLSPATVDRAPRLPRMEPNPMSVAAAPRPGECVDLERDLAEYEKAILLRALDEAGGVKKRAAELLGINYRSLRHRLQKYGLGDPDPEIRAVQ
jgi:transcriptional regulator with PAS, ATPase and Fis domain